MTRIIVCAALAAQALIAVGWASNSIVNLSHYDEMTPNFAQMKREGIVAVIHEASYPIRSIDDKYHGRQGQALRAGLLWGAYHFADGTDPIRQADHFIEVVRSRWRQSPETQSSPGVLLVLDFELNNHYPGGTMRPDQAVAFAQRIREKTGKYPGIYSGENRIRSVLNGPMVNSNCRSTLQKCWLWVANYHRVPSATAPWNSWTLWQYTGDGVCDLPRSSHPITVANVRKAERNFFQGSPGAVRSFWAERAWNPGR